MKLTQQIWPSNFCLVHWAGILLSIVTKQCLNWSRANVMGFVRVSRRSVLCSLWMERNWRIYGSNSRSPCCSLPVQANNLTLYNSYQSIEQSLALSVSGRVLVELKYMSFSTGSPYGKEIYMQFLFSQFGQEG